MNTGRAASNDPVRSTSKRSVAGGLSATSNEARNVRLVKRCGSIAESDAKTKFTAEISTQILLGSAGDDAYVVSDAHHLAARSLPNVQLMTYPQARHELFMETNDIRERWLATIDGFLDSIRSGARSPPNPGGDNDELEKARCRH